MPNSTLNQPEIANLGSNYNWTLDGLIALALCYAPATFALSRILDWTGELYATWSAISCVLIAWALIATSRIRMELMGGRFGFAILGLVGATILSSLVATLNDTRQDVPAMWRQIVMAYLPVTLFYACRMAALSHSVVNGFRLGMMGLLMLSYASIVLEVSGLFEIEAYGTRYFGFLSDGVAWIISSCALVSLGLRMPVIAAASLVLLLMTQSIGASLLIVFSIGVLIFFGRTTGFRAIGPRALILGGALLGASVFIYGYLDSFVMRVMDSSVAESGRLSTTELSYALFERSPIVGMGFNSQQYYYPPQLLESLTENTFSTPTSTAAMILADTGVFGFLLYFLFVFQVVGLCLSSLKQKILTSETQLLQAICAWLSGFLIVNQSAAWLLPGSYLSPLLFASAGVLVGVWDRTPKAIR